MSYDAIARRWARAVFEIGKEADRDGAAISRIEADLSAFATTFADNQELATILDNPLVPEPTRESILVEIAQRMGLSETAKGTLRLLARKHRLAALPDIARQLARLADEDRGVLRAEVTSAGPLSDDYLAKLRAELEKATGKKVTISHAQDWSLIGGVVTRIGDRVIDSSVRARLNGFRESLLR